MMFRRPGLIAVLLSLCSACAGQTRVAAPDSYKIVLVAGDDSLPVFDNAVSDLRARLLAHGASNAGDIAQLSASQDVAAGGVQGATLPNVLAAIAAMRPRPGQGCLVFATSHGGQGKGLWLAADEHFLRPAALNRALSAGCGDAPTAIVISGCFSGSFAKPPMTRSNRVILTAARPDRTSFGCGAGRTYTVYDKCLLDAFDTTATWQTAYAVIKACVATEEDREHAYPSGPQASFGRAVAGLTLPNRK